MAICRRIAIGSSFLQKPLATQLGLYYVHGRWYNPVIGQWLSPNEKGDYLYGGDNPAQDAVNWYVGQLWAGARWQYQQERL